MHPQFFSCSLTTITAPVLRDVSPQAPMPWSGSCVSAPQMLPFGRKKRPLAVWPRQACRRGQSLSSSRLRGGTSRRVLILCVSRWQATIRESPSYGQMTSVQSSWPSSFAGGCVASLSARSAAAAEAQRSSWGTVLCRSHGRSAARSSRGAWSPAAASEASPSPPLRRRSASATATTIMPMLSISRTRSRALQMTALLRGASPASPPSGSPSPSGPCRRSRASRARSRAASQAPSARRSSSQAASSRATTERPM
mmetsp:Transcript_75210/g.212705  ORF Transcript_75210/g.212705 Transcript_75210/m.212705 type:complete len:254 (+) Transcript_75210:138-899(+)